jgi:diguanylate cyclase (GGDEF)-like protein/PAS domain S-box-containing protein
MEGVEIMQDWSPVLLDLGILAVAALGAIVFVFHLVQYRMGMMAPGAVLPLPLLLLLSAGAAAGLRRRFPWLQRAYRRREDRKILLAAAAGLMLTGLVTGLLATGLMAHHSRRMITAHLESDRDVLARGLNAALLARGRELASFAANPLLAQILDAPAPAAAAGRSPWSAGTQPGRVKRFEPPGFVIRNLRGLVVAGASDALVDPALPLHLPLPGKAWLLREPGSLMFFLRMELPILQDGRLLGSLTATMPLPAVSVFAAGSVDRHVGSAFVVCARSNAGTSCLPDRARFEAAGATKDADPMSMALRGAKGLAAARGPDGRAWMTAYAPVGETGLAFILQKPERVLFAPLIDTARNVMLALPALVLLGLALLRWQLRPMVRRLHDSEQRLRSAFDYSGMGMVLFARDGRIREANAALTDMLGFSVRELRALPSVLDLLHPEDRPQGTWSVADIFSDFPSAYCAQRRYRRKAGDYIWVRLHVSPVFNEQGQVDQAVAFVQDVSELLAKSDALRRQHSFLQAVLDNMTDGVVACDENGRLHYMNHAAELQQGRPMRPAEPPEWGQVHALRHADMRPVALEDLPLWRALHGEVVVGAELQAVSDQGDTRKLQISSHPLRDPNGVFLGAVAIARDLTQIRLAQERLRWLAYHDALTGLPNRNQLFERIEQAVARVAHRASHVALFFLEVNRFKSINDTLGHAFGDQLLVEVGARLRAALHDTELLAHVGGDEFVVLSEDVRDADAAAAGAGQLMQALAPPFQLDGRVVHISANMGVAMYPADGDTVSSLFSRADIAMDESKKKGPGQWSLYERGLYARQRRMFELEGALRHALDAAEFVPYYQAKVDVRTGRIVGAEALLRWQRSEREIVAPDAFVPLLEDTGLIVPVGAWMLDAVCAQQARWRREGLEVVPVAVNCAAAQLQRSDLLGLVRRVLREHGLDAGLLELEITEGVLMHDPDRVAVLIADLRALGVRASIDDFGTGYSSLAYLKSLPVSTLKIDRAFIKDLPDDAEDSAITQAVLGLGHALGLRVVAEGVETTEQLEFLRAHGCHEYQGYYGSHPVPADEFAALLRAQGPR